MTDLRALPFDEMLRHLREHGEPADPRHDIDTASLRGRFPHVAGVRIRELSFPGSRGPQPARLYRDPAVVPAGGALVWVHGGAFIGGHLDMPESHWVAMELAAQGVPVLTLDYTKCLGDVHFPVPSDDVLAGWMFAIAHAEEFFSVAPTSVALGGASAGGNLAAGAQVRLRDTGGVEPAGLVLVYPVLHPNSVRPGEPLDPDTPIGRIAANFAGRDHLEDAHAFAGLADPGGFPPTFVVVCENDELRASGEVFASALRGVARAETLRVEVNAAHGHLNAPGDPAARSTIDAIASWMRRHTSARRLP